MPSTFLEIVAMSNGDIALRRSDDDGEPLVVIRFSEETKVYLLDGTLEVARAMIQAGIQAAAQLAEQGDMEIGEEFTDAQPPILH